MKMNVTSIFTAEQIERLDAIARVVSRGQWGLDNEPSEAIADRIASMAETLFGSWLDGLDAEERADVDELMDHLER